MRPSVDALLVIIAISTYCAANINATKILLVPTNKNSHVLFFSRLGVDMAKLGNVVTVIAPSNARVPDFATDNIDNFTYLKYPVNEATSFANSPEMSERMIAMAMSTSFLQRISILSEVVADMVRHSEQDCMQLLDNVQTMNQIREASYDFAIMDPIDAIGCYSTIPYSLGMSYGMLSLSVSPLHLFRVPRLASFPNPLSLSVQPTFLERVTTFFADFRFTPTVVSDNRYFMEKYVTNRPYIDMLEFLRRQSLWFYVEDLSVNYPLPQMPNTIAVGDIMAGAKVRPLSSEIKAFVSRSKHGVIIVSFGSYCDFFPPAINRRLCEAFTEVTKRFGLSVIWKLKAEGICRNDNILILPWIPQNDLLADSRVKLFISHGGFNSIIESVYHSKPLLIFPIAFDQPANAAAAVSKGFAIQMKIADFSSESLVSNINRLLTDPTYKRNASLASAIMRDRRDTPAQRVSAMIDHVIKYGDRHLRTGAFELSTFQFMMFDIFAALFAAAGLILLTVTLCCCCAYRHCFRRSTSSQEKLKSQ